MTEVEAAGAVLNEEDDKDDGDEIYSDPNGELHKIQAIEQFLNCLFFSAAVIVSFLDEFGAIVFNDKPPVMTDLMEWLSNTDEGELR